MWLLVVLFLLITFLEYAQILRQTFLINLGLTRYTIERILYLLPIIWAALLYGWKGGIAVSVMAVASMIPRAILFSPNREDALVETSTVFIIGSLVSYSLESLRRERSRRAKIEATQRELEFLLQQITRAQEEERKRIAWELHDDTIQSLIALCQQIDEVGTTTKGLPRQAITRLDSLHQQANSIMQEVRRLSQDLRPAVLDNLGLVSALGWLANDVSRYSGVTINLEVLGTERRFSNEAELVLFRIAQEALRNVWKHAQATSAEIILEFAEKKTRITIRDNGRGFDFPRSVGDLAKFGKLGLAGMQERIHLIGGSLAVKSQPGSGTSIIAEAPL